MSRDYSENILIQGSAADLLRDELGWETVYAYNTEQLGETGTLGRKSYKEILLTRYFREAQLSYTPVSGFRICRSYLILKTKAFKIEQH